MKSTSHSAQYYRYQTYSDALKNSFFPCTIPQKMGRCMLIHWTKQTYLTGNMNQHLPGKMRRTFHRLKDSHIHLCQTYRDQQRGSSEATQENQPQQSIRSRHDPCTYPKRLGRRIGSYPHRNFPKDLGWWRSSHGLEFSKFHSHLQNGDRFKARNCRPVSLTSLCCKLQEHIIVSITLKHLDHHKILTGCQHRFRAWRSCETQLVTLCHLIVESLEKNKQTDMIILDFSKAIDRVPH